MRCSPISAAAGYWGLLVSKEYGGAGAPFSSFAPFLTRMALVDPTVAGLASVHGCIGAVDPVRTFGNARTEATISARPCGWFPSQRRSHLPSPAPAATSRRFAPPRGLKATTTSSTARSCSSPTSCPGRTIGLVCLIDGKPAVLIVELPNAGKRKLPTSQIRSLGTQAHVQSRHHLPRLSRAGRQPAYARRAATA